MKQKLTSYDIAMRCFSAYLLIVTLMWAGLIWQGWHLPALIELTGAVLVLGSLLMVAVITFYSRWYRHPDDLSPWESQRILMQASGQLIPEVPTITNGSMLYAALILEETGETMMALADAITNHFDYEFESGVTAVREIDKAKLLRLREKYFKLGTGLVVDSRILRASLAELGPVNLPLNGDFAVEVLDGAVDINVVTCGFALACGLPGEQGYSETVGSNLSKIDPTSGVIEKTEDGKWIKGPNYYRPNLAQVIRRHACESAQ